MYQTVVPSSLDASSPASFLELINILSCNDNKSVACRLHCSAGTIFTGRKEMVAKVIFLHVSVIHSVHRGGGGVCLSACWDTTPLPPRADTHPWSRHPHPPEQTPPRADTHPTPLGADPPGADTPQTRHPMGADTPLPRADTPPDQTHPQSRLWHTVNEWPVRILLECILVIQEITRASCHCGCY